MGENLYSNYEGVSQLIDMFVEALRQSGNSKGISKLNGLKETLVKRINPTD